MDKELEDSMLSRLLLFFLSSQISQLLTYFSNYLLGATTQILNVTKFMC